MVGTVPPPQIPGYRDLALLGTGGFSEVYRAYQQRVHRWVAVKVLTFALADDRAQRRFLRECQVAGRLSAHPNIVTVYDADLAPDGRPYISMELFERGSVGDRLRRSGRFEVADALRVAISLAGALESAHRAGVVHRDVKPGNVLLAANGQPALTDFGLSVLAERQELSVGIDALTPYHAAPEVLEHTAVGAPSDVYSLASTTYAMLAGRAPHQSVDAPTRWRRCCCGSCRSTCRRSAGPTCPGRSTPPSARAWPATRPHGPTALAFAQGLQQAQRELGLQVTEPVVFDVARGGEAAAPAGGPAWSPPSPGAVTRLPGHPGPGVAPAGPARTGTRPRPGGGRRRPRHRRPDRVGQWGRRRRRGHRPPPARAGRAPAPSRATAAALSGCSRPSGTQTSGRPCASPSSTVPRPAWVTRADACGRTAAWRTYPLTTAFAGAATPGRRGGRRSPAPAPAPPPARRARPAAPGPRPVEGASRRGGPAPAAPRPRRARWPAGRPPPAGRGAGGHVTSTRAQASRTPPSPATGRSPTAARASSTAAGEAAMPNGEGAPPSSRAP